MNKLNRYVKVKGHPNWFMLLTFTDKEPVGFSKNMQERILRSEVLELHNDTPKARMDFVHRVTLAATREIDYTALSKKYGAILIREIGSFMPLHLSDIIEERFDTHFPATEFADILICENDRRCEYNWKMYLEKRFPAEKGILTLNYFDLRSEDDIKQYFDKATYITFSTTFTNIEWFEKLARLVTDKHKVIGYCHNPEMWEQAKKIYSNVEIIKSL